MQSYTADLKKHILKQETKSNLAESKTPNQNLQYQIEILSQKLRSTKKKQKKQTT